MDEKRTIENNRGRLSMLQTIPVTDARKIQIKLYVIGYKEQGESIIMLFVDTVTDIVVYSIVIDSCLANDGTNKTIEILNNKHVEKLNILCWTHPDTDHTLGIDTLVNDYCDKKTKILIPIGLYGKDSDPIDYNEGDQERIKNLYQYNTQKAKCVIPVGPTSGDWERICDLQFDDILNQVNAIIRAMSPHKDYIAESITSDSKIEKNQLSISLMVRIGELKFDFCGDLTSRTINNIWKEPFQNPVFLKTPHHTSRYSLNLLKILTVAPDSLGCTTTFSREGLPHDDAIQSYLERYQVFHTTGTTKENSPNYGIIEYTFDLEKKKEVRVKCYGHAQRLEKQEDYL